MENKTPRNFKEAMVFTCLMCEMMVFGLSMWNLFVAGAFSWKHVFLGFIPGFIVAFILDPLIVGPNSFNHVYYWNRYVSDFPIANDFI